MLRTIAGKRNNNNTAYVFERYCPSLFCWLQGLLGGVVYLGDTDVHMWLSSGSVRESRVWRSHSSQIESLVVIVDEKEGNTRLDGGVVFYDVGWIGG